MVLQIRDAALEAEPQHPAFVKTKPSINKPSLGIETLSKISSLKVTTFSNVNVFSSFDCEYNVNQHQQFLDLRSRGPSKWYLHPNLYLPLREIENFLKPSTFYNFQLNLNGKCAAVTPMCIIYMHEKPKIETI